MRKGGHTTIRLSDEGKARLLRLATLHGSQIAAIEAALERQERWDFPESGPFIIGYSRIKLAQLAVCSDCGRELTDEAWRIDMSDNTPGGVVCEACTEN
jgi:hypothetical protein